MLCFKKLVLHQPGPSPEHPENHQVHRGRPVHCPPLRLHTAASGGCLSTSAQHSTQSQDHEADWNLDTHPDSSDWLKHLCYVSAAELSCDWTSSLTTSPASPKQTSENKVY